MRLKPFAMRYQWPEQIDAMAERAGLRRTERYADFERREFGAGSPAHVTVYRSVTEPTAS